MNEDEKIAHICEVTGCPPDAAMTAFIDNGLDMDLTVMSLVEQGWDHYIENQHTRDDPIPLSERSNSAVGISHHTYIEFTPDLALPDFPDGIQPNCPLLDLPDELLVTIFEYTVSGAGSNNLDTAIAGLNDVASFAACCRRMRRIALNERSWSHLYGARYRAATAPSDFFVSRRELNFSTLFGKIQEFTGRALSKQHDVETGKDNGQFVPFQEEDVDRYRRSFARFVRNFNWPSISTRRITQRIRVPKPDAAWRLLYASQHTSDMVARHRRQEQMARIHREEAARNRLDRRFGRFCRDDLLCGEPKDRVLQCLGLILAGFPLALFILLGLRLDQSISGSYTGIVLLPCWIAAGIFALVLAIGFVADFEDCNVGCDDFFQFWVAIGIGAFVSGIFFLFPLFVALQSDGIVQWSWGGIFVPVYVFMLVPLVVPAIVIIQIDDWEEFWEGVASAEGLVVGTACISGYLLIAFSIMLPCYLDGVLRISLYELFIPVWIIAGLILIPTIMLGFTAVLVYSFTVALLFVVQPLLIALKVEGVVIMSWVVALIPMYVVVGLLTIGVCGLIIFKDEIGTIWSSD